MTEVGPPLGSARFRDADRAVQEFKMAKASPSIARGLKWRLSSALWPIDSYQTVCSASFLGSGKIGNGSARLRSVASATYPRHTEWKTKTLKKTYQVSGIVKHATLLPFPCHDWRVLSRAQMITRKAAERAG